ncbi:hypothetical protein E4T42_05826 [Aureobasidium subglaciale]|nr:hypothetical protein E4T42_05826 [Aureobasidium subglaciale]
MPAMLRNGHDDVQIVQQATEPAKDRRCTRTSRNSMLIGLSISWVCGLLGYGSGDESIRRIAKWKHEILTGTEEI